MTILIREYGFVFVSQHGSHVKLRGCVEGKIRITIIPLHHEMARGTLKSAIELAGLDYRNVLRFF